MQFRTNPSSSSSQRHPTCLPKHQEQSFRSLAASWLTTKVSFRRLSPPIFISVHKKLAVELGLVIGSPGRDIPQEDALSHIAGYSQSSSLFLKPSASSYQCYSALAVDMTARNVQDAAKSKGLPWSAAKGMDTFTPVG